MLLHEWSYSILIMFNCGPLYRSGPSVCLKHTSKWSPCICISLCAWLMTSSLKPRKWFVGECDDTEWVWRKSSHHCLVRRVYLNWVYTASWTRLWWDRSVFRLELTVIYLADIPYQSDKMTDFDEISLGQTADWAKNWGKFHRIWSGASELRAAHWVGAALGI